MWRVASMECPALKLESLIRDYRPGVDEYTGGVMAEAATICLDSQNHGDGVELTVKGKFESIYAVRCLVATDRMRRAHGDPEVATENGAYGIAILIIDANT